MASGCESLYASDCRKHLACELAKGTAKTCKGNGFGGCLGCLGLCKVRLELFRVVWDCLELLRVCLGLFRVV